ncbi:MAG: hypothetical protein JNL44_10725 [Gemmatimonadetes bacterium]|nr:hypothetical protein [Gemmatimonadota bacterium]
MRRILAASAILAAVALPAAAQNPNCSGASSTTADACEKATDLFNYMMPQLGTSLVGGSHTLGVGTTLGGFPHFAIALRGNAIMGDVPDLGTINVSIAGRQSSNIDTKSQVLGLPGVDFALGLYKGFPLGVTRVGGVDLIGSVTYIPDVDTDEVTIATDGGSTKIGIGARVGLLEQSLIVPGVSFSYLVRDLPTLTMNASAGNADFTISDFSVKTKSWRLAAQKNLMIFQLGLGVGQDTYESAADVAISGAGAMNTAVAQEMTRTTLYGSVGFNLLVAKVVGEVGQVSGGDISTYNNFSEAADKSRLYGSVGIRISF